MGQVSEEINTEAIQIAFGGVQHSTSELLDEYVEAINGLLRPKNITTLQALMHTFEGELVIEPEVKLTPGGPTFRHVVLPGELQPAEWPKYRYLLLELWKPAAAELRAVVDGDRTRARSSVAHSLYRRRLAAYCQDNRLDEASLTSEVKAEILAKARAMYEEFLAAIVGKKVTLDKALFEQSSASTDVPAVEMPEDDASAGQ